jgi:hypothetical protein
MNGASFHGGVGTWLPPINGIPQPMPRIEGDLVACKRGYHILRAKDLIHWLGPELWEIDPASIDWDGALFEWDKIVVRQAALLHRLEEWNNRTARLFAADCAESVVHLVANEYRVAADWAIDAARRFANSETDAEELAAAFDAAVDASTAAARVASMVDSLWAAAMAASRAVARAAARAAARAVFSDATPFAWTTTRAVQTKNLCSYLGIEV